MSWVMSLAAGAAIGYFLYQFILRSRSGENGESAPRGRLHRSATDKKVAGVCGGLAEYLNADPSIVRLVTVLLMLGWGSGVLVYIICAIILPEGE